MLASGSGRGHLKSRAACLRGQKELLLRGHFHAVSLYTIGWPAGLSLTWGCGLSAAGPASPAGCRAGAGQQVS